MEACCGKHRANNALRAYGLPSGAAVMERGEEDATKSTSRLQVPARLTAAGSAQCRFERHSVCSKRFNSLNTETQHVVKQKKMPESRFGRFGEDSSTSCQTAPLLHLASKNSATFLRSLAGIVTG